MNKGLYIAIHGEQRRAQIIDEGLKLWRIDPAIVNSRRIGKQLGLTHGAVLYHMGTTAALKDAVAVEAVRIGDPVIVPMLIAAKHPATLKLTLAERMKFMRAC